MSKISFAVAACLAASADARWSWGNCPEYQRQPNFNKEAYMGTWYNLYKNYLNFYELGSYCVTANYKLNEDGSIRVYNHGGMFMWYTDVLGKAVQSEVTGPGSFVVDFWKEPDPTEIGGYNVVETDYETYALFYSCKESTTWWGWTYTQEAFSILGREPTMSQELVD